MTQENRSAPPRDDLVRAVSNGAELTRAEEGQVDSTPLLHGHFSVFDQWSEIASSWEGNFMERIAPGAFSKTIAENRDNMRVLFQHGNDPQVGDKPIASIRTLEEDSTGAYYEAPLLNAPYVRDQILPGLEAGLYGASFRFRVMREEMVDSPKPSSYNPKGLPERTITEAQVYEFGPVTFGAYSGATAGVRSMTDQYRIAKYAAGIDPAAVARMDTEDLATLAGMIQAGAAYIEDQDEPDDQKNIPVMESALAILASLVPVEVAETEPVEPEDEEASSVTGTDVQTREVYTTSNASNVTITTTAAAPPHPTEESRRGTQDADRRANTTSEEESIMGNSIEEMRARQDEIRGELQQIAAENFGSVLDPPSRARWNVLKDEMNDLEARCREETERQEYLHAIAVGQTGAIEDGTEPPADEQRQGFGTGTYVTKRDGRTKTPDNTFDLTQYHGRARDQSHLMELYRDGARAALETFNYPHERAEPAAVNTHIEKLINSVDSPTREFSRRILVCGSPTYRRAFWKTVAQQPLTQEEQRAMSQAQAETRTESMGLLTGGGIAAVPIQVDPTIIPTSSGWINPIRQIARVFTTTSYVWQGVTSAGAVAQYQAEAATMINNAGTLVAPTIQPERVTSFIPYSWELAQDWGSLESELAQQIQDAKDTLEATKFALGAGHGSNEPQGILVGASTAVATSNGTTGTGFALTDVYLVENALPVRFIPNAKWVASVGVFQKIRSFGSSLGPQAWADSLIVGNPPTLLGYPAYKSSTIGTSISGGYVAGAIWGVFGDWSRYAVVDRLGMQMRVIPDLFGGTAGVHFPTGQSGLSAYWRNSAAVLDSGAFRVGTISKGVN